MKGREILPASRVFSYRWFIVSSFLEISDVETASECPSIVGVSQSPTLLSMEWEEQL